MFIGCFLVKIRIDHADVISDEADADVADDTDLAQVAENFTDVDDSDANQLYHYVSTDRRPDRDPAWAWSWCHMEFLQHLLHPGEPL